MKKYHLTTPQQNIWNLQKYYSDTAVSNLCGAMFYQEKRDPEKLKLAVCRLLQNQSGLRLRFCDGEEPKQYVPDEAGNTENIPVMQFPTMAAFERYAKDFAREPVRLSGCGMCRFVIFEAEGKSGVLAGMSHLIADAWTFGLIANQIDRGYRSLEAGTGFLPIKGDYRQFIESEREYLSSGRYQKDKAFWEEKYAERPEGSPVKQCAVPPASIAAERLTRILPALLEQKMDAFCEANRISPAVLFETAVVLYLSKINGENRSITIGVPVLNRSGAKEKNIAGMFISTMPLTVTVDKDMPAVELAGQIAGGHREIFRHQKYPYAEILRWLREKQSFSGRLYDVMVSYQNARTDTEAETKWYFSGYCEVPLEVHIDNRDKNTSHTLNVDYQTAFFSKEEAACLIERLEFILGQITEEGGRKIRDIAILPKQERQRTLEEFNDTAVDYPRDKCVHELFEEQAHRTPDKTALVFRDRAFTYRQLDEMSNSLAHYLRKKGIGRGDVVPIIAKRSWHIVVAMLGILKAGAAYMPVSPDYPADRIITMLETAGSRLALLYGYAGELKIEGVELDRYDFAGSILPIENGNQPGDICYVIFTSGSTGKPKGVSVCHRNIVNYCHNNNNNVCSRIIKDGYTGIVSVTNFIFDIFVTETLLPLLNGMTIYFADDEEVVRQDALAELVERNRIEVIQTTPTKMRSYLLDKENTGYLRSFKAVVLGGEAFPADLYAELKKHTDAQIFNIYGPAETTVWSTNAEVTGTDITIGRPIANTQIYIVDGDLKPLPIGVAGELCIAGDGVGLGYLNRPELTAERFVKNPFATAENRHGKTLYRTGDLARWREDGEIEYLGRMDTQVKIRGLRIELGEIESVMAGFPGIALCAVADKKDENGRQYLVGYYTPAAEAQQQDRTGQDSGMPEGGMEASMMSQRGLDEKELRNHLSKKLPKYMIPNYFMRLDAMPMTPSGKTDRKNLPLPDFTAEAETYHAPETATEEKLAQIWAGLLKLPKVGRTDDFFDLGGDSLLALSLLNEIAGVFSVEISMREVMENTTLEGLARCIEECGGRPGSKAGRLRALHKDRHVLLPQQKAVYAACKADPAALLYNMPAKITLPRDTDRAKLKQSIYQVFACYRILKCRIQPEADEIYCVYEEKTELLIEENVREQSFFRPFDLEKAPLFRAGFTEDAVLFDLHHIIADGETVSLLLRGIGRAYEGKPLQESELWYGDYAGYFINRDFQEHKKFFRELLRCDFEKTGLPKTKHGKTGGKSLVYQIPEETVSGAKAYAAGHGLTDTMLFFGAYGILLSKYTAKKDVLTSIILQNRMHRDTREMPGMFVNTLPVHLSVTGGVKEYYESVKRILLDLFRYQELPFSEAADAAGMQDKMAVNTSFVYQADGEKAFVLGGEKFSARFVETHTSKFDFSMEITPEEKGCRMRLEYNCEEYDKTLMDELAAAYVRILEQMAEESGEDISGIRVLSDGIYRRVVEGFNDTAVDYPRDKCVHELFQEQAQRTPDKIALVFRDREFTYRQLDEMSNSLARCLREKGIGRGDVVPIVAKRSWHIVAAMLGILKAGAAFVLVNPTLPEVRIKYMVKEAKSKVSFVYDYEIRMTEVVWNLAELEYTSFTNNLEIINAPTDAAVIIYTSGSTGTPKGAVLTHQGIGNYCCNNMIGREISKKKCKKAIATTNIVFDAFLLESIYMLVNGITVYLVSDESIYLQSDINRFICKEKIDFLFATPSKMLGYMLNKEQLEFLRVLKIVVFGGEKLEKSLYEEVNKRSDATIFNVYGPSETTINSTIKLVETDDITIGRPIANTQIYIVDGDLKPLPIGVAGELCIAGDGVGLGYLNRPELTAERFVKNPFATAGNKHGKTLYRTGDLARWREDGEIEYLGRMDTQVKIRGLRIELGEIESVMAGFPGIALCAVADKKDENGRQYLVGYYTLSMDGDGNLIDEKELRNHLSVKLPKYMVPNYFLRLEAMPMTPSGKTDRKNLPLPDFTAEAETYHAPETATEEKLAQIWAGLLKLPKVGRTDDFFDLGGDSLLAISLISEIAEAFDAEVSVKEIMENPALEQLALCIEEKETHAGDKAGRITHSRSGRYVLLPQQKAIYAACQKEPESLVYNIPAVIPLPEETDREKLKAAVSRVAENTKILKSSVKAEKDEIYGIYEEKAEVIFESYPLPGEQAAERFVRPFDLGRAPLFRVGLAKDALLFDIHHVIADGETVSLLLRDIAEAYQGKTLRKQELWYGDYAAYIRKRDFNSHRDFFKELLRCDFEKTGLPETKTVKPGGESLTYSIPEETFAKAEAFAEENHLTDTAVFFGAYGILLSKYTAKKDVLTSIILQNRMHRDTREMPGMFVNTLPVHLAVTGGVKEYYENVKRILLDLFRYQEISFWDAADAAGMDDKSVVNTSFVYQADGEKRLVLDGKELAPKFFDTGTAKFDFSMEITPVKKGGRMRLEYDRGKYDGKLMDGLADAYIRILEQMAEESGEDISGIRVLSDGIYRRVVEGFNDTAVDYPRDKCVHELFQEQAHRTPDKTALVFRDRAFTYRQLDEMSNSLAHYLREKGIGRGDVVPIVAKRSWHIVVAVLGILKAGAAYMPVSPDYPADRISYMLKTARSRLALTYGFKGDQDGVECVELEAFDFVQDVSPAENGSQPGDMCYVIFTSGSTGTPKGAVISHYNLANFCSNNKKNVYQNYMVEKGSCIVSATQISFDIFTFEIMLSLLNGICVVLADDAQMNEGDEIAKLIKENAVDIIHSTPSKMAMFTMQKKFMEALENLKVVMIGAESFPPQLYEKLREHTKAAIFNGYGPTETTIGVTFKKITNTDITIGRPIANTQIYIVDGDLNPLPIGVAGELCIAGDGVGLGYLNRPELTAERFVKNPFATAGNKHGKTLYRTGDLARWREDGEIEYLGRIDTQVKIRGLRIELGEIESVMAGFPGIALCAVSDKKDENGRQYLVGYYTLSMDGDGNLIDEKELRNHLSVKLPKYMVPNYFMQLEAMPMTPSGKTDRKNLPIPDFTVRGEEYIPPETDKEKTLCGIVAQILGMEKAGAEDDFFGLGGDSLAAVSYVAKAHDAGIDFSIQNVFDYPTVRSLCVFLEKGAASKGNYQLSDFDKYGKLFAANVIEEAFVPEKKSLGDVLLTGATGFLGAHILDCLMKEEAGKIYCLVRGNGGNDRRGRLKEVLEYYFDGQYSAEIGNRIIPVVGDIEDEELCERLQEKLAVPVQTVIHTAASVKHFGSYEYFRRVNCEGTRHVAEYAKAAGARLIHISTLSVSGNSMAEDLEAYRQNDGEPVSSGNHQTMQKEKQYFDETSFYIGQPLDNVYIRSKFEAEKAVYDAMLDGLDAVVVRVGNLTNRLSDFKFQLNYRENAFLKRVKALLEFGRLPDYLLPLYAEFSPVDKTAEGIVKVAQYAGKQCVFHVYNNRHLYYDRLLEVVQKLGISMKVTAGDKFYEALQQTLKKPGTQYIYEAFQNDMDKQGRLRYDSDTRIRGDFTVWFLRKTGFEWNEVDMEYIRGYVEYFRKLGFLEV